MAGIIRRLSSLAATAGILALAVLSAFHARPAGAVIIEGYTPSGNFQTVFVSDTGRLFVEIDSSTPQHVIVDGGTITVKNILSEPVQVEGIGGAPVAVSGSFTATASTSTTMVTGQHNATGSASSIYPNDNARKQGCLCNGDSVNPIWTGFTVAVSSLTGFRLPAGACECPDVPSSYIGAIFGVTDGTSTVSTSFFYVK